jgi:hypothetical protein
MFCGNGDLAATPPMEEIMRKIRLDPEELVVEAFPTTERMHGRGTVRGYVSELPCDDSAECTQDCGSDGMGCTEACDPVMSGYDPNSLSGCAAGCYCPLLLGTAGQTSRC